MEKSDAELIQALQARHAPKSAPPCPVCGAALAPSATCERGVLEWAHLDAQPFEHFEASRVRATPSDPNVMELIARYKKATGC